jgi:N-acetyl-gamma-glutamyl-phosphate reductase
MKPIVYIDGREGTTGLQIYERLGSRDDIELLLIDEEKRKDPAERKACINAADVVFLCLPDDAARQAAAMAVNPSTRIIDASTAHRTDPAWDYGFPELSGEKRRAVAASKRVANPGCHATGFLACVAPLVAMGILPDHYPVACFSLTGYSGGGKKMIAEYEGGGRGELLSSPCMYALGQNHKHLPEMQLHSRLKRPIVFSPVVDDYYKGMATTVLLHNDLLTGKPTTGRLREALPSTTPEKLVSGGAGGRRRKALRQSDGRKRPAGAHGMRERRTDHRHRPV